jgi:large subunit ribosomal protein L31
LPRRHESRIIRAFWIGAPAGPQRMRGATQPAACSEDPMKPGIHPEYREVVFQDISNDFRFITRSTVQTKDRITWQDGKEYPLYKLETSSESHPFYTGAQTRVVETGRVEKFRQKFAAKTQQVNAAAAAAAEASEAKKRRRP